MAELVYAYVSEAYGAIHGSSNLPMPTQKGLRLRSVSGFYRYNYSMRLQKFKLWHSLAGMVVLLLVERGLLLVAAPALREPLIDLIALVGAGVMIYVGFEIIEEVKSPLNMLVFLSAVVAELVVFFAFQYLFLLSVDPQSFPTLGLDPVSLLLNSVYVFVFNPLYLPADGAGRTLLLINTMGALGLVLFILQNITQFRRKLS